MPLPFAHQFCHRCGSCYNSIDWPRNCVNCQHVQWHNPTPIGALIQPVTDGIRNGVLTPIRAKGPRANWPGMPCGYQEVTDQSSQETAAREFEEEINIPQPDQQTLELLTSRSSGPLHPPGKRHNIVFSVNPVTMHVKDFAAFAPNQETLRIHFSWEPEILAFPEHTYAMALYFKRYLDVDSPEHFLKQPRIGEQVWCCKGKHDICNIPLDQPFLKQGVWVVEIEGLGYSVGVIFQEGKWTKK